MKNFKILLVVVLVIIGSLIILSSNLFSKDKYRCTNFKLSEKNYIQECRMTAAYSDNNLSFADKIKKEVKTKVFCRCIFRTFNVRLWANRECSYEKAKSEIMNMSLFNTDVEEYCGHLRP